MPPRNELFAYDLDGNMTEDGLWTYTWDAESRLVEMNAKPVANAPANRPVRLAFNYDYMGRRIYTEVWSATGLLRRSKYLWDGWNLLSKVDQAGANQNNALVQRTYIWGLDMSESFQGAGGVGGLLGVQTREPDGALGQAKTYFPCYDGNGNVMSYLDGSSGTVAQEEEYGPFGENLRPRETNILRVPIGWSSKETDEETGLVAYQLRYYNAELGRWMSKDPIEEAGGVGLYGFVENRPVSTIDILGLVKKLDLWIGFNGAFLSNRTQPFGEMGSVCQKH